MFLQYFKIKRNNYKKQTFSIYQEIVNHSNHFIKNSLNDKNYIFDEVFEIFSIVTVFYLKKLKDTKNKINNEISQRIIDSFIKDLDQNFREKGIGDISIGKYVKSYVKKFYFRLSKFPNNKISIVFGCGGERDQDKRSKMGNIASNYSDKIYITDDNPRHENPSKIRRDINFIRIIGC